MQKLPAKELEALGASPEALATYLASLSPDQIKGYVKALHADKSMPQPVQKTLIKLFTQLEAEAAKNQATIEEELLPLAVGIATAMKLLEQIEALEALERSL